MTEETYKMLERMADEPLEMAHTIINCIEDFVDECKFSEDQKRLHMTDTVKEIDEAYHNFTNVLFNQLSYWMGMSAGVNGRDPDYESARVIEELKDLTGDNLILSLVNREVKYFYLIKNLGYDNKIDKQKADDAIRGLYEFREPTIGELYAMESYVDMKNICYGITDYSTKYEKFKEILPPEDIAKMIDPQDLRVYMNMSIYFLVIKRIDKQCIRILETLGKSECTRYMMSKLKIKSEDEFSNVILRLVSKELTSVIFPNNPNFYGNGAQSLGIDGYPTESNIFDPDDDFKW